MIYDASFILLSSTKIRSKDVSQDFDVKYAKNDLYIHNDKCTLKKKAIDVTKYV